MSRTLDIETQNSQWCNLAKLPLAGQTFNFVEINDIELDLAHTFFLVFSSYEPVALLDFNPCHSTNFTVNHESQGIKYIRLKSSLRQTLVLVFVARYKFRSPSFNASSEACHILRMRHKNFEKLGLVLLVVHDRVLLNDVNLNNSSRVTSKLVELILKFCNIRWLEFTYAIDLYVKVSSKVMDVGGYRVSTRIHTKQSNNWLIVLAGVFKF